VDANTDTVSGAIKGAATAALTAAAMVAPAVAGTVGSAQAASNTADKPLAASPLGAAAVPAHDVVSAPPCAASAQACVSLSRHEAWLTDDHGRITYGPVPATGGSAAYPTPTGTFRVLSKNARFRSTEFHNAPMPYSVFFHPGDAFHADNVAQRSHGCIHLNWNDAEAFFNALKVGDQVQILP